MTSCIQCNGTDLRYTQRGVEIRVPTAAGDLQVHVSEVPTKRCATCDESYFEGPDLERADLLASAEALRRGFRDGPTMKFTRRALGLRAAELGELLDLPVATISQWESGGRVAERSVWNTLADLVSDGLAGAATTLDRLRAPAEPRLPENPVPVTLGGVGAT